MQLSCYSSRELFVENNRIENINQTCRGNICTSQPMVPAWLTPWPGGTPQAAAFHGFEVSILIFTSSEVYVQ